MFRSILYLLALALLSGGAFAGYQYWTSRHTEVAFDALDREPLSEVDKLIEPEELLKSLDKATSELIALSAKETSDTPSKQVQELHARVAKGHVELKGLGEDDRHFQQSRWNLLYATYAATSVDPAKYRDVFNDMTSKLFSEEPKSDLAANAALLQILVRHDFDRPVTRELFLDLNQFTSEYPPALGVKLFGLIAGELLQGGQRNSAQLVLQHGVKTYQSTSEARTLSAMLAKAELPKTNRSSGKSQWTIRWDPVVLPVPRNLRSKVNASKKKCKPKRGRT